jgi:hypothetical protein
MAEQLPTYQFPTRGRPHKYAWESWINGNPWKLVKGTDFAVTTKTMQANARTYAKKNDLTVKTAIAEDGNVLVVQFFPKG